MGICVSLPLPQVREAPGANRQPWGRLLILSGPMVSFANRGEERKAGVCTGWVGTEVCTGWVGDRSLEL